MRKGKYKSGLHPKEKELLHSMVTGEGLIPIDLEQLQDLAKAAGEVYDSFEVVVSEMTLEQAKQVREWRCGEDNVTWRGVAQLAWNEGWFDRKWYPPSNQLMGMALCEKAAKFFDEDYMQKPWN